MSDCHCLYSHASQFIVQSTLLTAICYAMLRRFGNVSRRFERSQSHHLYVNQRRVHITTAEILRLSAVSPSNLSLSH